MDNEQLAMELGLSLDELLYLLSEESGEEGRCLRESLTGEAYEKQMYEQGYVWTELGEEDIDLYV